MSLKRCINIDDLERLASRRLPAPVLGYLNGAADDEVTRRRNCASFDDYQLVPRYLVDVDTVDLSTTILGQRIALPLISAPTGFPRLFHSEGERAVATAVAEADTIYTLSTVSTFSIEDVAAFCDGPKWFQIYSLRDRALTGEFIERCRETGYHALVLTVDVPVAGNRERDHRTGLSLPPKLTLRSMLDIARRPRWVWQHLTTPRMQLANMVGRVSEANETDTTLIDFINNQFVRTVTWDDAAWIVERWGGPFLIKGILSTDDALRARDIGASGVILSNHGGRQLDSAPSALDMLPAVRDAVGDDMTLVCDGGIRRGTDVLKALALGADACMTGRPFLWGLAAAGVDGVRRTLEILRAELERDMMLLGCRSIKEVTADYVQRVGQPPSRGPVTDPRS